MKVWVTGSSGQVGQVLLQVLKGKGIDCFGTSHKEVDIADEKAASEAAQKATHIVNAAGFTQVDPAEIEREEAYVANVKGPEVLAKIAKEKGIKLLHISTDYVFDGKLKRAYIEEDATYPLNWYGQTKREGEIRVLQNCPDACIVRVSWVFGGGGSRHYAASILRAVQEKKELRFVDDQKGSPTYAWDFADALIHLLPKSGIYHYCNHGCISKYQFALAVLEMAKKRHFPILCERIVPIQSSEFFSLAIRPLYTPLNTHKIEQFLSIRPWQEGLKDFFERLGLLDKNFWGNFDVKAT